MVRPRSSPLGGSFVADTERNSGTTPRRSMNCTVSRDKARSRLSSRLATSCIMRPSCCKIFYSSDDAGGPLSDNLDNAYRALTVQVHSLGEFVRYQSRARDRWSSARCWRKQKSVSRSMSGGRCTSAKCAAPRPTLHDHATAGIRAWLVLGQDLSTSVPLGRLQSSMTPSLPRSCPAQWWNERSFRRRASPRPPRLPP